MFDDSSSQLTIPCQCSLQHLQTERHRSGVPPKNPRRRPNYSHTSDSDQISGSDDEKPTVAPRRSRRSKRQRPIDGTSDHETSDDNSLEDAKSHDGSLRAEKSARTSSGKDKKSLAKSGSHNNNRKSGTKSEDTQKKEVCVHQYYPKSIFLALLVHLCSYFCLNVVFPDISTGGPKQTCIRRTLEQQNGKISRRI